MKRRPKLQLKPNVPVKLGSSKSAADVNDDASVVDASPAASSLVALDKISGPAIKEDQRLQDGPQFGGDDQPIREAETSVELLLPDVPKRVPHDLIVSKLNDEKIMVDSVGGIGAGDNFTPIVESKVKESVASLKAETDSSAKFDDFKQLIDNLVESTGKTLIADEIDDSTVQRDATVDVAPESTVVISNSVLSKIRHRFTKIQPTLSESMKQKKSSCISSSSSSAVVVDDQPFIPPPVTVTSRSFVSITQQSSADETLLVEEVAADDVMIVLSPEKAAAKLIARKLKQKQKKRALENVKTPIDSSKVFMKDLIYMIPINNPMKPSSFEISSGSKVTSVKKLCTIKEPLPNPQPSANALSQPDDKDDAAVPQVRIGPDGSIILNEASLVIERKPVQNFDDMEMIDETDLLRHGYPKKNRTRSWTTKETKKFFAALSMIGTDFSLMCRLFPNRNRADLKRKFKREEKVQRAMIETALRDRRSLDISLLAEPSSEEEDTSKKRVKSRKPPGKRGRRKKKEEGEEEGEKKKSKNERQKIVSKTTTTTEMTTKKKKWQETMREKQNSSGKRSKKKKSRYYEESSEGEDDETEENLRSDGRVFNSDDDDDSKHRTIAKNPSPHSSDDDDEDEFDVVNSVSKRPTRSGRVPKPVKIFNIGNTKDFEKKEIASSSLSAASSLVAKKRNAKKRLNTKILKMESEKLPSLASILSPVSASALDSSFSSRISCSLPLPGSMISQLPFLPTNIAGLENLPPGKQLLVVASPAAVGENGEPQQQLLHIFMVSSSEEIPGNSREQLIDRNPLAATAAEGSNVSVSCSSDQMQLTDGSQINNDVLRKVIEDVTWTLQHKQDDVNQTQDNTTSVNQTQDSTMTPVNQSQDSTMTSVNQTSLRAFDVLRGFPAWHSNNSFDSMIKLEKTNNDLSVSGSTSATEYFCESQTKSGEPVSVGVGERVDFDYSRSNAIDHNNIKEIIKQDDGTLVIVARTMNDK